MTINDMDDRYYSQYFRRYGQNITEREIEELSVLSAVLSPLRKMPTPLQILADSVCLTAERSPMSSYVDAQLFVSFMSELLKKCNCSENSVSLAIIRGKLSAVSDSINAGSSQSLNGIEYLVSRLAESYRYLDSVQDNTTAPSRRIRILLSGGIYKTITQKLSVITSVPQWLNPIFEATMSSVHNLSLSGSSARMVVPVASQGLTGDASGEEFGETDLDADEDSVIERFKEKMRLIEMERDDSSQKLHSAAPFNNI